MLAINNRHFKYFNSLILYSLHIFNRSPLLVVSIKWNCKNRYVRNARVTYSEHSVEQYGNKHYSHGDVISVRSSSSATIAAILRMSKICEPGSK